MWKQIVTNQEIIAGSYASKSSWRETCHEARESDWLGSHVPLAESLECDKVENMSFHVIANTVHNFTRSAMCIAITLHYEDPGATVPLDISEGKGRHNTLLKTPGMDYVCWLHCHMSTCDW